MNRSLVSLIIFSFKHIVYTAESDRRHVVRFQRLSSVNSCSADECSVQNHSFLLASIVNGNTSLGNTHHTQSVLRSRIVPPFAIIIWTRLCNLIASRLNTWQKLVPSISGT